jgi:hypothetical protein
MTKADDTPYKDIYRSHAQLDERTLALHRLACAKLSANPVLFERIPKTLARWRKIVCKSSQPYLSEWQRLVDMGMHEVIRVATDDSECATALRQSSPFCGILTPRERADFFRRWQWRGKTQDSQARQK